MPLHHLREKALVVLDARHLDKDPPRQFSIDCFPKGVASKAVITHLLLGSSSKRLAPTPDLRGISDQFFSREILGGQLAVENLVPVLNGLFEHATQAIVVCFDNLLLRPWV